MLVIYTGDSSNLTDQPNIHHASPAMVWRQLSPAAGLLGVGSTPALFQVLPLVDLHGREQIHLATWAPGGTPGGHHYPWDGDRCAGHNLRLHPSSCDLIFFSNHNWDTKNVGTQNKENIAMNMDLPNLCLVLHQFIGNVLMANLVAVDIHSHGMLRIKKTMPPWWLTDGRCWSVNKQKSISNNTTIGIVTVRGW